jgi:hypothetical protein
MKLLLAAFLLITTSSTAMADHLKDSIRYAAEDIAHDVDRSSASRSSLQEVLDLLDEAKDKLNSIGGPELFCKPENSSYSFVAEIESGRNISTSSVRNADCQTIISKTKNGLVCAPDSSSYAFLHNYKNRNNIGTSSIKISDCLALIASSNELLVCGPDSSNYSNLYKMTTNAQLGTSSVRNERCSEIIQKSSERMTCAPDSSNFAILTMIDSGRALGESIRFDDCFSRIQ